MASHRAIAAVTDAVVHLLESQYDPANFDGNQLQFKVYVAKEFAQPMDAGVSLFLYRIYTNQVNRTPNGMTFGPPRLMSASPRVCLP